MCFHVRHVGCCVVYLYISGKPPDGNREARCETRSVGINSKILGGTWQQEMHSEWKTRSKLSLSLDRGHEGRTRKVPQEDGCSSMYKSLSRVLTCIILCETPDIPCNYLCPGS
jgi:hypothetical protein